MVVFIVGNDFEELNCIALHITRINGDAVVKMFSDPLMALKTASNSSLDYLFTSEKIRRLDGHELVRTMRLFHPELKICYIYDEYDRAEAVCEEEYYLTRPLAEKSICDVTARMLNGDNGENV